MITEEQAEKIIGLLEKIELNTENIATRLSNVDSNTSNIKNTIYDLDDLKNIIEEIRDK